MSLPGFTIEVQKTLAPGSMRLERRKDGLRLIVDSTDTVQALLLGLYDPTSPSTRLAPDAAA
ncbi:MAG: hypothetical protein Kow0010_16430 [Dehalococcoidia bacterium]